MSENKGQMRPVTDSVNQPSMRIKPPGETSSVNQPSARIQEPSPPKK
ncbi:hypothetical protein [Brevibacillus brevis]|nr:hypothetical protein [Brevibacillus brevis]